MRCWPHCEVEATAGRVDETDFRTPHPPRSPPDPQAPSPSAQAFNPAGLQGLGL